MSNTVSLSGLPEGSKLGREMTWSAVSSPPLPGFSACGTWSFYASLGPRDDIIGPVTLGKIMDSLVDLSDTSLCSSLPDFVADIVILGGDPQEEARQGFETVQGLLNKMLMPKSLPILDHLEQPFDELGFF